MKKRHSLLTHTWPLAASLAALSLAFPLDASAQACFSDDSASSCQAMLQSNDTAPPPSISQGIRLNSGVTNALFNTYGTSCRFVDNNSGNDYFIPQSTSGEFASFVSNLPVNVLVANCAPAVPSAGSPYKASASIAYPSYQIFSEGGAIVPLGQSSIATVSNIAVPTDQSVGRVATATTPGSTAVVSTVVDHGAPIAFYYTRQDCRVRSDGSSICNTRNVEETQILEFSTTPSNPPGQDGSWIFTGNKPTYFSQSMQTGAWNQISSPTADYEPPDEQSCTVGGVTYANGQTWAITANGTQSPTAAECPYGAGTQVDTVSITTTYMCNDGSANTQSATAPQEISSTGECAPSPFEAADDSSGAHAYLYQLTPISNRHGLSGLAGNVNLITAAARIPDVEFHATQIDIPDQSYSLGFPGYPNLNTWFGVCYDGGYMAPVTGQYTIVSAADDGVAIWVDGVLIDDYEDNNAYSQITTNTGAVGNNMTPAAAPAITLQAGLHDVVIEYYQGWASNLGVQVWIQAPNQPQTIMQLVNPPNGTISCPH